MFKNNNSKSKVKRHLIVHQPSRPAWECYTLANTIGKHDACRMNEQFTEYLNCWDIVYFISFKMFDKQKFPDLILKLPLPVNLSYWKEPKVIRTGVRESPSFLCQRQQESTWINSGCIHRIPATFSVQLCSCEIPEINTLFTFFCEISVELLWCFFL